MTQKKNPTKVVTGKRTVFSYLHVIEPKAPMGGGTPKYSVSLIIPKSDTVTIAKIRAASEEELARLPQHLSFSLYQLYVL